MSSVDPVYPVSVAACLAFYSTDVLLRQCCLADSTDSSDNLVKIALQYEKNYLVLVPLLNAERWVLASKGF